MSELKEFQKLVISNAANVRGLQPGEMAPDFALLNASGRKISLGEKLATATVVLKFYRGEWCPICNLDLKAIQELLPQIESLGAVVMAISPQNPDGALTAKQKNELGFEVLSDPQQEVIKAYGLQFDPGEDYHQRRDLTMLNGDGSKTLPVPATYIINRDFTIEAAHVEANYTERMPPEDILRVLESINN